jgi:hypothetical protein
MDDLIDKLLFTAIAAMMWSVGGVIGGIITAFVIERQQKMVNTLGIILGWGISFALGGAIWFWATHIFTLLKPLTVNPPWVWNTISGIIGLGIGAGIAGILGSALMLKWSNNR